VEGSKARKEKEEEEERKKKLEVFLAKQRAIVISHECAPRYRFLNRSNRPCRRN
jgi:hypothetical protein